MVALALEKRLLCFMQRVGCKLKIFILISLQNALQKKMLSLILLIFLCFP